ncbi:hypothetical protein K474DRAFT_1605970 [Panus rudis PR-1116 ss-1]|nr:hypothetical protein K474DRAFT_1605970 [Panus rudis PR-1116 ss-1]
MRPAISSHSTFEHSVGTRKTQDVNVVEEDEEGVRERTEESKEVCGTTSVDSGAKDVQGDKDSTESESAPDPAPAASKEKQPEGLIRQLSHACRTALRQVVRDGETSWVYDNVNWAEKVAEQILGRKDSQTNGTCATAFPLFGASPDDMKTSDLNDAFFAAPPLSHADIRLSQSENLELRELLSYTVLRILIAQGGGRFKRFQGEVDKLTPPLSSKDIPLHKTDIYPLPAMQIDESSTVGNAEVVETIFKEAGFDTDSEEFLQFARILWGDQLSVARLRSATGIRIGHDSPSNAMLNNVYGPGLSHYQLSACGAILEVHWGDSSTCSRNPGSLCFHNTLLDRKPIVLSSPPPYHTSRDLIFVSLYARVFHCLELVSGKSLDEYAADVDFETLQKDVITLVSTYANNTQVSELRQDRLDELGTQPKPSSPTQTANTGTHDSNVPVHPKVTKGDMVYENAMLFMRDALVLRAFTEAIKSGASGRIVLLLKVLALAYRGAGRPKYAYETMTLINNLVHVWPKPLRDIVLNNWLVNPTGKPDSWLPVDLLQEHMNYWIKVVYKAHGSNASFEWLKTITPCIDFLRQLATQINQELGSRQGSKHSSPDLWSH